MFFSFSIFYWVSNTYLSIFEEYISHCYYHIGVENGEIGGPKRFRPKAMLIVGLHLENHLLDALQRRAEANLSSLHFSSKRWTVFNLFEFVLSRQDRAPNGHEAAVMNEEKKKGGENEMRRDKGEEEEKNDEKG